MIFLCTGFSFDVWSGYLSLANMFEEVTSLKKVISLPAFHVLILAICDITKEPPLGLDLIRMAYKYYE